MSSTPHLEAHFKSSGFVRDIVLGMSDGLTVPFALAAGLSGAVDNTSIIIAAGLAEIAAGSISMGLGGYLAARSEREHYEKERQREYQEIKEIPDREKQEVVDVFAAYGLTQEQMSPAVTAIVTKPDTWVDFMMRFELGLNEPDSSREVKSAVTIGASYVIGGLVPLSPYFVFTQPVMGLKVSIGLTVVVLLIYGYIKGRFISVRPWRSALQTTMVSVVAAAAAYTLAKLVS